MNSENEETPAKNNKEKYNIEELQMKLNDLERKLEESVEVNFIAYLTFIRGKITNRQT